MLDRELKLYQSYIDYKPSDHDMLVNLTKLQYLTRGELFDMIIYNKRTITKKQKIIIVISLVNLMLNLVNMTLLLLK